jgi:hypothetical protein
MGHLSSPSPFDLNQDQAVNLSQHNRIIELMWYEAICRARCLNSLPKSVPKKCFPRLFHIGRRISWYEWHDQSRLLCESDYGQIWGESDQLNTLRGRLCILCENYTSTDIVTLMHLKCNSNIYRRGRTTWKRNMTCGGSSGGKGL